MNTLDVVNHLNEIRVKGQLGGQEQLAEILNLTQPTVSYRIKHKKPVLIEEAMDIAKHSDLTLGDFLPVFVKEFQALNE